jgi:hypothetical protein
MEHEKYLSDLREAIKNLFHPKGRDYAMQIMGDSGRNGTQSFTVGILFGESIPLYDRKGLVSAISADEYEFIHNGIAYYGHFGGKALTLLLTCQLEPKEQKDQAVFREFADVCPLLDQGYTAENRKPREPDILCTLRTGEKLAFELVSVDDVIDDVGNSVAKIDSEYQRLTTAIASEYKAALADKRISDSERFNFHTVRVSFQDQATFGQRQKAISRVIELLDERGPGMHVVNEGVIRSVRCEPYAECSYTGPMFAAGSTFCAVANSTVANIKTKILEKTYKTEHPIHLLAWSDTASIAELPFWQDDLETLLRDGTGQFDRIWVYGRGEKSIVFDSDSVPTSRTTVPI